MSNHAQLDDSDSVVDKPHARVICLGNEKGGSGKSTTAIHILIALMTMGKSAGALDLDSRQKSLARYVENRSRWARQNDQSIPIPDVRVIQQSKKDSRAEAREEEKCWFEEALSELCKQYDYVVIDSPGADTHLSHLGHASADTIITPMNDSFVDLDLLAKVDPESLEVMGPSLYSEMIWESRKRRALKDRVSIDWILMRNRLASLNAKNKRRVGEVLEKLAPRTGFRIAPGFGERVIYRELFPSGLTLLDIMDADTKISLTMSHVAARQELRDLMVTLNLPGLEGASATF